MGIFEPYRAIGYITSGVPFSVQRLGTETFVTVSVGKAFQVYNVLSLSLSLSLYSSILCERMFDSYQSSFLFFQCAKLTLVLVGKVIYAKIYIYVNNNDVILCVYFKTL